MDKIEQNAKSGQLSMQKSKSMANVVHNYEQQNQRIQQQLERNKERRAIKLS